MPDRHGLKCLQSDDATWNEACVGSSLNHAAEGGDAGLYSRFNYRTKNRLRKAIAPPKLASFSLVRILAFMRPNLTATYPRQNRRPPEST